MVSRRDLLTQRFPLLGCLLAVIVAITMCVWLFVLVNAMQTALTKLHLHPVIGFGVMIGIVARGFVNFPVHRWERDVEQLESIDGALEAQGAGKGGGSQGVSRTGVSIVDDGVHQFVGDGDAARARDHPGREGQGSQGPRV